MTKEKFSINSMEKKFPRKSEAFKALFLYFLFIFIVGIPIYNFFNLSDIATIWADQGTDFVFLVLIFLYYSRKIPDLKETLKFKLREFLYGFFSYFLIFLLIDQLFVYFICGDWKSITFAFKPKWITLILCGGIIGPFCEEIFHRGVILKLLLSSYSLVTAIILNGFIFGILHFGPGLGPGLGWWSWVDSFAHGFFFAILLSIVTCKTKNLSFAIGFHIANNFLTLLTM